MVVSYIKRMNPCVVREQPRIRHLDSGASMYDRKWRTQSFAFLKCYPFCVMCLCNGVINQGAELNPQERSRNLVVDHIVPHEGDVNLFHNQDNWETLCKMPCHDRHKQSCERTGKDWFAILQGIVKEKQTHEFVAQHKQWIPKHIYERVVITQEKKSMVTVIYGPPGSGKTTLSKQLAVSGDVIFDLDEIAGALGMAKKYPRPPDHLKLLLGMREGFIASISHMMNCHVYVIVTDQPAATELAERLNALLITPPKRLDVSE